MHVVFCSSPIISSSPDELYLQEAAAAKKFEMNLSLLDFEALTFEDNAEKAIRKVRRPRDASLCEPAIYRGWMMPPTTYQMLYRALQNIGIELINSPQNYKHCHYLPEWFDLISSETPASVWIDKNNLGEDKMDLIAERLKIFNSKPLILKDFVKSEKHFWLEACFIPDASDREAVARVVSRFLELRGTSLEGGLVFRQFLNLQALSTHSKSGMPLTKEFRLFVLNGKVIHWFNYWEEGDYGDMVPPIASFADLAKKVKSNFYTMDIAQDADDKWWIVELGDGQVAGLPENTSTDLFYQSLRDELNAQA